MKDLTVQQEESVEKKMGYENWNMWLLKLVWVARNNFACEVYVQLFSEKHVKRVNFYFKCKSFSQKWYLRSVDEQELRILSEFSGKDFWKK